MMHHLPGKRASALGISSSINLATAGWPEDQQGVVEGWLSASQTTHQQFAVHHLVLTQRTKSFLMLLKARTAQRSRPSTSREFKLWRPTWGRLENRKRAGSSSQVWWIIMVEALVSSSCRVAGNPPLQGYG